MMLSDPEAHDTIHDTPPATRPLARSLSQNSVHLHASLRSGAAVTLTLCTLVVRSLLRLLRLLIHELPELVVAASI